MSAVESGSSSGIDELIEGEGFPNYVASTNEQGLAYDLFVLVYSVLSVLLVIPLVIWGRQHEKQRQEAMSRARLHHQQSGFANDPLTQRQQDQHQPQQHCHQQQHQQEQQQQQQQQQPPLPPQLSQPQTSQLSDGYPQNLEIRPSETNPGQGLLSSGNSFHRRIPITIFREIDRFIQRYPDEDPDFMSVIYASQHQRSRAPGSVTSGSHRCSHDHAPSTTHSQAPSNAEQSHVLSAATTSRLYQAERKDPKTQVWDVGSRRWKQRRPIGRPDGIHRAIQLETESMGLSSQARLLTVSRSGTGSRESSRKSRVIPPATSRGMSEVASSILTTEEHDNPGHRVIVVVAQPRKRAHQREQSFSSGSEFPSVLDDISPNDAADACDPGRVDSFHQDDPITVCCGPTALWTPRVILMSLDALISVAEPDIEMKRIISLGLPLTLGAMSDALLRAITIAFISHYSGTDSMIAFVIVNLLIGFTDELVGAVADAEHSLCSNALITGQLYLAGQYVQISTVLLTVLAVPLLAIWTLNMENIVYWLVDSDYAALVSKDYTKIIVFHHFLRSLSRIFTVLFQLTGNEKFETTFGLIETIIAAIVISAFVSTNSNATLTMVAWIQLTIGATFFTWKLAYAIYNAWFRVFRRGMLSFALMNGSAVKAVIFSSSPLVVGAFLEYGEWEMLLLFVSHLGPAEVAAWSILGVIWKVLETSTEGIGEAAAIRVAYHLGHNNPAMAERASFKAIFIAAIQSLFVTAILFMFGKNIIRWLTTDATLQNMLNDTISLLGLGNVVMTYSMVMWSSVGSQGRYRLATLVILVSRWLVTIPYAAVMVYAFKLDLSSLMGSVIVGFATAGLSLAYVLLRSDWERLATILQELNAMMEFESDSDESSDEESEDNDEADDGVVSSPASIMRRNT